MAKRQIIAMGGGGFSMEPENPLLDRYVLAQASRPNPVVCFVPTASGDSQDYIGRFHAAFANHDCQPRHLSLLDPPSDMGGYLAECDVIYVGGGNTRNMLASWREWGIDRMLRDLWDRGVILCGLSAGAICWFDAGHTDSKGPLAPIKCLGFLSGSCTPHYDSEPERRPSYLALVKSGALPAGYALDDGAAIHFIGESPMRIVTSRREARAFLVRHESNEVVEEHLPAKFLG